MPGPKVKVNVPRRLLQKDTLTPPETLHEPSLPSSSANHHGELRHSRRMSADPVGVPPTLPSANRRLSTGEHKLAPLTNSPALPSLPSKAADGRGTQQLPAPRLVAHFPQQQPSHMPRRFHSMPLSSAQGTNLSHSEHDQSHSKSCEAVRPQTRMEADMLFKPTTSKPKQLGGSNKAPGLYPGFADV